MVSFEIKINLYNSHLILLFVLCASCTHLFGQTFTNFNSKSDSIQCSGKAYYDFIEELNSRNRRLEKRGTFTYQLDSLYGYIPAIQIQNDDLQSSNKYFFSDSKEVSFGFSCNGSNCAMSPDSYSIERLDDKGRFLSRGGTLWDGENYEYDCNLPQATVFTYDEDLVRSMNFNFGLIKDTLIYDDNNLLVLLQRYLRSDVQDTFRLDSYFEYSYNLKGWLESIVDMDYRSNFGGFIPEDSIHNKYYSTGELLQTETFFPSNVFPVVWEADEVYKYQYNSDSYIKEVIFYDLLNTDSDSIWQLQELAKYDYGDEGSLDSISYYDIRDPNAIIPVFRKEYTYDRSILLSEIRMPWQREPVEGQQHMLLKAHNYEIGDYPFILNSFGNPYTIEYYYKECDDVSTDDPVEIGLELWPNPVKDQIHLTLPDGVTGTNVSVYHTSGRLHLASSFRSGEWLDVSTLEPGPYFIKLVVEGRQIVEKFIKL